MSGIQVPGDPVAKKAGWNGSLLITVLVVGAVTIACVVPFTMSNSDVGSFPRTRVSSTAIYSVAYYSKEKTLDIEFTSRQVYRYVGVPVHVASGLMAAESKGKYFNEHIKNAGYQYTRIGVYFDDWK